MHTFRVIKEPLGWMIRPTLYRHEPSGSERPYARLLLPAWGEGQVRLLLGGIEWR